MLKLSIWSLVRGSQEMPPTLSQKQDNVSFLIHTGESVWTELQQILLKSLFTSWMKAQGQSKEGRDADKYSLSPQRLLEMHTPAFMTVINHKANIAVHRLTHTLGTDYTELRQSRDEDFHLPITEHET